MKNKSKKIWLYVVPHRSTKPFYTINGELQIKPNRVRIKSGQIVYIRSGGEKNFTTVVLKDKSELFFDGSMKQLQEKLVIKLIAVNRHTKIHLKHFNKTLGYEYIFSDFLEIGIKISKVYRSNIKKHLE